MRFATSELLETLREVADLPAAPDPLAQTAPVVSFDTRLRLSMGQGYPNVAEGAQWIMSNNALYYFCRGLSDAFMLMQGQVAVLTARLVAQGEQYASLEPRLALNEAGLAAALLSTTANAAGLVRNDAADQAAASKAAASELRIAALEKQQALADARLTKDEALIATAQARADSATLAAAAAQAKADQDALASAAAQATASQALATAQAAQAAQAALLARIRQLLVPTPSATIQVATPLLVPVVFATPYPDASYSIELGRASAGLVGTEATYLSGSKTGAGFTIQLRNLGIAALVVSPSTVDVFCYRGAGS